MLAARAYIKASWEVDDIKAKAAYRKLALQLLKRNWDLRTGAADYEKTYTALRREVSDARKWYEGVAADEKTWIAEGKNPELEFANKYFEIPKVKSRADKRPKKKSDQGEGFF